jgi:hypothetical protein
MCNVGEAAAKRRHLMGRKMPRRLKFSPPEDDEERTFPLYEHRTKCARLLEE